MSRSHSLEALVRLVSGGKHHGHRDVGTPREDVFRSRINEVLTGAVASTSVGIAQGNASSPNQVFSDLSAHVALLQEAVVNQTSKLDENTKTIASHQSMQSSVGATISHLAGSGAGALGGLFGVVPLLSGLFSLFSGSDTKAPSPQTRFSLPQSISYEAAAGKSGYSDISYGQNGLPQSAAVSAAPSQITLNIHALDSRSILDRSDDIALAVRKAMLSSHGLNDVFSEM